MHAVPLHVSIHNQHICCPAALLPCRPAALPPCCPAALLQVVVQHLALSTAPFTKCWAACSRRASRHWVTLTTCTLRWTCSSHATQQQQQAWGRWRLHCTESCDAIIPEQGGFVESCKHMSCAEVGSSSSRCGPHGPSTAWGAVMGLLCQQLLC
jgi:hypothetical protein